MLGELVSWLGSSIQGISAWAWDSTVSLGSWLSTSGAGLVNFASDVKKGLGL